MYIAWNAPTKAVSAAEIDMAANLTEVMFTPAACAALSRSRTAVR